MEGLSHVYDCTQSLIFFSQSVIDKTGNLIEISNEQYAKTVRTLSAPAMIMELNHPGTRYYFRAICWEKTLLIGVSFINGIWEVTEYLENPSGAFILTLIKKNLVQRSAVLYFQNDIQNNTSDNPLFLH